MKQKNHFKRRKKGCAISNEQVVHGGKMQVARLYALKITHLFAFTKQAFLKKSTRKHSDFHPCAFIFFHLFCKKTNFCRVNHTLLSFNSCQRYGIFGNKTNIKIKKIIKQHSFDIKTQNIVYKTTFYNISGCFCELENVRFLQEIHKKIKQRML